jgi:hypothetical protein
MNQTKTGLICKSNSFSKRELEHANSGRRYSCLNSLGFYAQTVMNTSTDKNSSSSEQELFSSHDSSLSTPHFHTPSSSSIYRHQSGQKKTVVKFHVKITNICVIKLPKKVDSHLTINFANFWTTTTRVVKGGLFYNTFFVSFIHFQSVLLLFLFSIHTSF